MSQAVLDQPVAIAAPKAGVRPSVYALLFAGIICIAVSAILTKWAHGVPGTVSAFYRLAIASAVLAIPYARERKIAPAQLTRWQWALAIGAGVFFALDLAFWNTSLSITNAANATVLGNVAPIVVGLGAIVLFHERPKGLYYVGLIVAIVGMSIIGGWDALAHTSLGLGDLLAVIGGIFYGGYLLSTQRIRERMTALTSLWVSGVSGSVFLLLFNLIAGRPLGGFALGSWAALLALGVISQALGWLAINHALGHIPASRVSVLLLLQPVLTAIFAVPLLGEALGAHQIIGGLIAITGIALVNRARG